jgi:hypothetical protein
VTLRSVRRRRWRHRRPGGDLAWASADLAWSNADLALAPSDLALAPSDLALARITSVTLAVVAAPTGPGPAG